MSGSHSCHLAAQQSFLQGHGHVCRFDQPVGQYDSWPAERPARGPGRNARDAECHINIPGMVLGHIESYLQLNAMLDCSSGHQQPSCCKGRLHKSMVFNPIARRMSQQHTSKFLPLAHASSRANPGQFPLVCPMVECGLEHCRPCTTIR